MLYELPSAQGWALVAWAVEADPNFNADRAGDGYVAQGAAELRGNG